mmetsp:Transcript_6548/g.11639  ORF Transcript_6548/g.11639 Transcript_6548/m.11639 type:complete len:349 (+) Transcript_6548:95-1141(+)|eukprot:CAMPEP_0201898364 /NCGR_PEP_ID=MMETSP0902-20130614/48398_1 /ASSEMBLY_ACC=CAM_ASM_000551 /TAXON_ID=420261 /ORGANISM="Thalassiosira antarctica, Strain CCMP982" /LENGTH=348 /DNA_ID=CAMNT_0048431491 /DNA_START=142 /DNA_END=1188 /DNA_ORIENTATION=-
MGQHQKNGQGRHDGNLLQPQNAEEPERNTTADMIVSKSSATDGPSPDLTVTVTDSITELANQMQLINETIGRTLSSSKPASASSPNQVCAKCVDTSEMLIGLQSELGIAMKRVEKMNQTLTVLQTHVNGLQRSIKTIQIQSQVYTANSGSKSAIIKQGGQHSVETMQSQVNAVTSHSADIAATSKSLVVQRGDAKRTESNNRQQSNSQQDANKAEAPNVNVSFREMLHKRRMGSTNPIPTMGLSGANTKINNPAQNIETLDELILSCAPYLTGPPVEYTAWLHDELNINTIADLSEAVADNLRMLVAGNGSVGMWQKQKFCDAVRVAAAWKSGTDSSKEDGIDEVLMS